MELLGFQDESGTLKDLSGTSYSFDASNLRLYSSDPSPNPTPFSHEGFVQFDVPTFREPLNVAKLDFNRSGATVDFNGLKLNAKFDNSRGIAALVKYVMDTLQCSSLKLDCKLSEKDLIFTRLEIEDREKREFGHPGQRFRTEVFKLSREQDGAAAMEKLARISPLTVLNSIGYELDTYYLKAWKNSENRWVAAELSVTMSRIAGCKPTLRKRR